MSFRTLLVHLDDSRGSDARRAIAINLAQAHGAHLIGLYAVCRELIRPIFSHGESLLVAVNEAQTSARAERAEAIFRDRAERDGCSFEWRVAQDLPVDALALHARHADLVIVGQYDESDPASYIASHFVEDALRGSGTPYLVMPARGSVDTLGRNVLIAWDGSREAARALEDALPLLHRASQVTVVEIRKLAQQTGPNAADAVAHLERHGVRASFMVLSKRSGQSVGTALLKDLETLHGDLLVMGAYGSPPLEERLMGGTTQTVLKTMKAPIFVSH